MSDVPDFSFSAELLNAAEHAVIATDREGRITLWNRFAEELYGWTAAEVTGRPIEEITPSATARDSASEIVATLLRGATWAGDFPTRRRDGSEFIAHVIAAPIRHNGVVLGAVGVSVDWPEQRASEMRHRAVRNVAPDPIFRISRQGRFLEYMGPVGARLFRPPEVFLGQTARDLLPPDIATQCEKVIGRAIDDQHVVTAEFELELDLRRRLYEARVAPCGNDEVIAIVRDITEARRFQAELHARVTERADEIERLSRRLVFIQDEEWRHIGRELHDEIGQTVTALAIMLKLARHDPAGADARLDDAIQLVDEVKEAVRNLSSDLIAPVETADLAAALRLHAQRFSRRTHLPITIDLASCDGLTAEAARAIFRIVQEALTNVVRHANASGATLRAAVDGSTYRVEVEDDGEGFDAATFRFGAHAGLWGMRERARLAGGELTVESTPGSGTTIRVTVPMRQAAA